MARIQRTSVRSFELQRVFRAFEEGAERDIAEMSPEEIKHQLDAFNLSPDPLVKRVIVEASPTDAIIDVARESQLEPDVLRGRLRSLKISAVVALLGFWGIIVGLLGGFVASENAITLSGILIIGFSGAFLGSIWAWSHLVMSNAFYARVQLEDSEAKTEECINLIQDLEKVSDQMNNLQNALEAALTHHPKVRDILAKKTFMPNT